MNRKFLLKTIATLLITILFGIFTWSCSGNEDTPNNPENGQEKVFATEFYCENCALPTDPKHPTYFPPEYLVIQHFSYCLEDYWNGERLLFSAVDKFCVPGTGGKFSLKLKRGITWSFEILKAIYPLSEDSNLDHGKDAIYCAEDDSDSVTLDIPANTTELVKCVMYRAETYNICGRCHKRFDMKHDFRLYIYPQRPELDNALYGKPNDNPDVDGKTFTLMCELNKKSGLY